MKSKFLIATLLIAPLTLIACAKKDATNADQQSASTAVVESEQTTPEQQAKIDAIDKPVLDEKNTDVPAEKSNAPSDAATPASE